MKEIELSKCKHIYHIYSSSGSENDIHVEKYYVPYCNSKYVYYVKPGCDMLMYFKTDQVIEDLDSAIKCMNSFDGKRLHINTMFWYVNADIEDVRKFLDHEIAKYKKDFKKHLHYTRLCAARNRATKAMFEYEKLLAEEIESL